VFVDHVTNLRIDGFGNVTSRAKYPAEALALHTLGVERVTAASAEFDAPCPSQEENCESTDSWQPVPWSRPERSF
jgi:hypothetical protein